MAENDVKLSIIIVSFNKRDITAQCLRSIYAATWDFAFEIILVDNHSQDDTLEYVRLNFPDIRVIANDDNKLFAIANNQGAKIAKGEYLLLLNNDTIVEGDNLSKLVHYLESLPEKIVCVGPKILNPDASIQSQGHVLKCSGSIVTNLLLHKILPDALILRLLPAGIPIRRPIAREVGWVLGACMLVRADYYHASGGLNERLIFYGEEPEFSWRAKKNRKETWYYPEANIIHLGGASTDSNWGNTMFINARLALVKLTYGIPLAILEELTLMSISFFKLIFTFKAKYREQLKTRCLFILLYLKNF